MQHWITTTVSTFQGFIYFQGGQSANVYFSDNGRATETLGDIFLGLSVLIGDSMIVSSCFLTPPDLAKYSSSSSADLPSFGCLVLQKSRYNYPSIEYGGASEYGILPLAYDITHRGQSATSSPSRRRCM
jgi:hypothetical protein